MKKTLLGFGLLPLAILSVGVVASCSSTEEPTVSTLEKEATKFNASVVAKDKTITAAVAAAKIIPTETAEKRLAALKTIATTIPTLSKGFTMIVNSATVSEKDPKSVQVKITITETASAKTKDVVLTITGFVTASKLEVQASKFNSPVEPKNKEMMASEATATIKTSETAAQRLTALQLLADVPTLDTGFTMTINSAKVSATDPSTVEVAITITETSSTNTKDVVLRITGFLTREALLELEAAKFATMEIKPAVGASWSVKAWLDGTVNNSIISQASKLNNLKQDIQDFPIWDQSKYTIFIGQGTVFNETSVQFQIIIATIDEPVLSKEVIVTVTGFKV